MVRKRIAPRLTLSESYSAAQSFLVHIGAAPHRVDEAADGIVEMEGGGFFSRLRYDDAPITQAAVLALLKTAEGSDASPVLFSATGYSGSAEVFDEHLNVALFSVDRYGGITPHTPAARHLMPTEPFEAPFMPTDADSADITGPRGVYRPGQSGILDHEWLDCPVCGTTHHPEANFCHRCGGSLSRKNRIDPTARSDSSTASRGANATAEGRRRAKTQPRRSEMKDTAMRCRICGSHDVEVLSR